MSVRLSQPDTLLFHEIAGYQITDFISAGVMSQVFRAQRAEGSRDESAASYLPRPEEVAVKLLSPALDAQRDDVEDFQRRFEREAQALLQLEHPNILPIIDFGKDVDSGCVYMILPYMAGGSLASVIAARGRPPLARVAPLLTQIAGALDYAHAQGIVHRDVKPGNILLDAAGASYLGDFGIVRMLAETVTERTTIGRVLGSPAYMAPEQITETEKVGPLSDLYGLGMVAYQLVTGRVAFETTNLPSLLFKQVTAPPPPPRSMRPELPEPAEAAILHALEKDPSLRFPTAGAFAEAFTLGMEGEWADGLADYMASATAPASALLSTVKRSRSVWAMHGAPSFTSGEESGDASSLPVANAQTWTDIGLPSSWRDDSQGRLWNWGNVRGGIIAALLLALCLVGVVDFGANQTSQASPPLAGVNNTAHVIIVRIVPSSGDVTASGSQPANSTPVGPPGKGTSGQKARPPHGKSHP
ncbi:MAG TPA: serine/threonine-protein kinase [Ktedonobacterales bacterium]